MSYTTTQPHRSQILTNTLTTILYILLTIYLTLFLFYRRIWGWWAYYRQLLFTTFLGPVYPNTLHQQCVGILKEPDMWARASENRDWWMRMECEGLWDGVRVREVIGESIIYSLWEGFSSICGRFVGLDIPNPTVRLWRGIFRSYTRFQDVVYGIFEGITKILGYKTLYEDEFREAVPRRGFASKVAYWGLKELPGPVMRVLITLFATVGLVGFVLVLCYLVSYKSELSGKLWLII
jgi:hypothetical protein